MNKNANVLSFVEHKKSEINDPDQELRFYLHCVEREMLKMKREVVRCLGNLQTLQKVCRETVSDHKSVIAAMDTLQLDELEAFRDTYRLKYKHLS